MYVITAGEVAIVRDGKRIAICGVGELVGELAALDGQPRSATAVAYTDCVLVMIDRRTFELLIHAVPTFAPQVLRTLTTRLRGYQSTDSQNAEPAPWRTPTTRLQGRLRPGSAAAARLLADELGDEELAAPTPID